MKDTIVGDYIINEDEKEAIIPSGILVDSFLGNLKMGGVCLR